MKVLRFLTVQTSIHAAQDDLQNPISVELAPLLALKRHRVNDIPQILISRDLGQLIVELIEMFLRLGIPSHLEELDPDLPRRRIELVQLLGGADDGALHIVRGLAVGDHDDVQRLRRVRVRLVLPHVDFEDLAQLLARRRATAGSDLAEDFLDGRCGGHVLVERAVGVVQEVDVDAVAIVGRADWCDRFQRSRGFGPSGASHTS